MAVGRSPAWWVAAVLCALTAAPRMAFGNVHTVFTTEVGCR